MKKFLLLLTALVLAAVVAFFSPGTFWRGWLAAAILLIPAVWTLDAALRTVLPPARRLVVLVALAFLLRLGAGLVLNNLLPRFGYPNPTQSHGYVFYDAYRRDTQAWDLAQSAAPLSLAFSPQTSTDQYGGLLFISALVYRTLSPDAHRALLVVILGAWAAALGLPYLYRLASAHWGESAAWLAALWYALYPEAILQSAAQMREPFLIGGIALATWGGDRLIRAAARRDAWALALGLGLLFFISPGVAAYAIFGLSFYGLVISRRRLPAWMLWTGAAFIGLTALSLFGLKVAGSVSGANPVARAWHWLQAASGWDMYLLEKQSGWVQKLLSELPPQLHGLFIAVFGLTQPALPATLVEPSVPLWRTVNFLRAFGWYLLVPLLFLGLLAGWKDKSPLGRPTLLLSLLSWGWIVLAAVRAGGDQWDNPRYRVIFLAWQVLVAAQGWLWMRRQRDPWLWRVLSAEGVFLFFFLDWYLSRYTGLVRRLPFWQMLAAIGVFTGLLWLGEWLWRQKAKR